LATHQPDLGYDQLLEGFHESIAEGTVRGLDRVSPAAFERVKESELSVAARKLREGTYRFTPYLEVLQSKGRGRCPRVLSVPTVRDRVVLVQLKELLHARFPDRVGRILPNAHIRAIKKHISGVDSEDTLVYRADIVGFYDNINHALLELELGRGMRPEETALINRALRTPTVPRGYRRSERRAYRPDRGVPQGLAISNVLANIYLRTLDEE